MLDSILGASTGSITYLEVLWCMLAAAALGLVITLVYMYKHNYNRNFVITLAMLPTLIGSVILLVNGNLGAGVAVAGAFGLVRFRSAPGGAREIASVFFASAIGLATGMGYLLYAALFTGVSCIIMLLYIQFNFGVSASDARILRITLPEDIDYSGLFDDLFSRYTRRAEFDRVRTTNLGSLLEVRYTIVLKDPSQEKPFIDEIRKRNGNLSIICARQLSANKEML